MINKIAYLHDEVDYFAKREELHKAVSLLIESAQFDLCDLYLEMAKHQDRSYDNETQSLLLLFVFGQYLTLLHPFVPLVSEQLRYHMGFA